MNAADYILERQNTEAALTADDDEVVAAIGGEESEDFED